MAKRFSATEIWEEDWFLDMPNEYKLFWYYMLANCDHAGIYKVNVNSFQRLLSVTVSSINALNYFNAGKKRIRVVSSSIWFIEDFFVFQYGQTFNWNNKLHESAGKIYNKYNINVLEFRGLKEVKERTDKGLKEDTDTLKDKDKEIDKSISSFGKSENLLPRMVKVFKSSYPDYPSDQEIDFPACLQIAQKIAKSKGWKRESVCNGNLEDTVGIWTEIVEFSKGDSWFSSRSISDFNKEYQRLIQKMNNDGKSSAGTVGKTIVFDKP
jgi:hypothetical protein